MTTKNYIKTFNQFVNENINESSNEIDIDAAIGTITIDKKKNTAKVYVDIEGWDSSADAFKEIGWAVKGKNDPFWDDIDMELEDHNLEVNFKVKPKQIEDNVIEFGIKKS